MIVLLIFLACRRDSITSKTWPLEKRLAQVFVENRVIKMTRYAIRFMPPIAVFLSAGRLPGRSAWASSAHCAVHLRLPIQGLWWLGKRSVTPLPPAILNWFYEVRGKLQESGQVLAPVEGKPDYQALADTLKRAFKQLDKTFLDDL
ncbi:terminus macrodomain insulation protein YfbV [Escherichia coli]